MRVHVLEMEVEFVPREGGVSQAGYQHKLIFPQSRDLATVRIPVPLPCRVLGFSH